MHTNVNFNTVWSIEHADPNKRYSMKSQPVELGQPVLLEHCGTAHYLASDLIEYRNDFGTEYEVSVHSYGTLNKSQSLSLEKSGKKAAGTPTKFQEDQNIWSFVASQDPSTDFDPAAEAMGGRTTEKAIGKPSSSTERSLTPIEVFADIKQRLMQRGGYGLRGLSKVFKRMDQNGNNKLDAQEFCETLDDFGLYGGREATKCLFEVCDKNKDGNVDYSEFLKFLRGEMNATRRNVVAMAYAKLDKNKDGQVTLDDIAATYSAQKHPEVLSGKKKPEDIYREFMKNWDTEVADSVVTQEEFTEYFKDLSALIPNDDYFVLMVKNAWKL
eukprot:TRINITY_DN9639_c0_g3_i1.p1 TRINITY_DN9639_c0_g3~~TRINITY_DN9639_c0_g3_i1.p1  ORF type:complete len:327 (-),score=98.67 TRINITY_DN9639_c0_g3_i1:143-1123(-)